MADMTNMQCPACTGPVRFDGVTGRVVCDYCGSTYSTKEIEDLYAAEQKEQELQDGDEADIPESMEQINGTWELQGTEEDWGEDAEKLKTYSCKSCGAELICDETTAATECPYCGNPTVMQGQFSGAFKPEYIVPFKITKEQAINIMKDSYKGKKLLPPAFKNENHIKEIKGVYVPFWLFDAKGAADTWYRATKVHRHENANEVVTETKHFQIHRKGTVEFNRVPVDASTKMPDDYMDSIEPYDYSEIKKFSVSYLPGFMADRYDVSVDESSERADKRMTKSALEAMRNTISNHYTSVDLVSRRVVINRGKVRYALMPVWMLTTKFKGENYLFAINGQTGKLASRLPVDKGLCKKYFAMYAVVIAAIASLVQFLLF